MAEALAQGPPRSETAPQLSAGTQRLEELAVKQSRQLIPMTPSMPKALKEEVSCRRRSLSRVNGNGNARGRSVSRAQLAFNEKNKEKVQLITRLMELVSESEKMRMKKLEELSKSVETIQ